MAPPREFSSEGAAIFQRSIGRKIDLAFKVTTRIWHGFRYFEGRCRGQREILLSCVDRFGWVDRPCPNVSIPGHCEPRCRGPNQSEETPVL